MLSVCLFNCSVNGLLKNCVLGNPLWNIERCIKKAKLSNLINLPLASLPFNPFLLIHLANMSDGGCFVLYL